jgi:two-component sensor histidine kinase
MALIHEQLYEASDYAQIPFHRYAASLAQSIASTNERAPGRVRLALDLQQVSLPVDRAIPCGLLLNELVTNALKHAFPDERRGTLRVALHPLDGGRMRLVVADDGVGMPPGKDLRRHGSVGSQIIVALCDQLGAELSVESSTAGTQISVTLAMEDRDA